MLVDGFVSVKIYNLMGQLVTTLHEGNLIGSENNYSFIWDATDSASGIYMVKAEANGLTKIQKLMLIK